VIKSGIPSHRVCNGRRLLIPPCSQVLQRLPSRLARRPVSKIRLPFLLCQRFLLILSFLIFELGAPPRVLSETEIRFQDPLTLCIVVRAACSFLL